MPGSCRHLWNNEETETPIGSGGCLVQRCGNNGEYSARYFRQRKAEEGGDAVHR